MKVVDMSSKYPVKDEETLVLDIYGKKIPVVFQKTEFGTCEGCPLRSYPCLKWVRFDYACVK